MCPVEATESSQQFPIARYDYLRLTSEENCVVSTSKFPRTFAAYKNDWTQMILEHQFFFFFLKRGSLGCHPQNGDSCLGTEAWPGCRHTPISLATVCRTEGLVFSAALILTGIAGVGFSWLLIWSSLPILRAHRLWESQVWNNSNPFTANLASPSPVFHSWKLYHAFGLSKWP